MNEQIPADCRQDPRAARHREALGGDVRARPRHSRRHASQLRERADANIPASFLYQVAQKFHVDLTSLLTGEEPRLHVYAVTRAGTKTV